MKLVGDLPSRRSSTSARRVPAYTRRTRRRTGVVARLDGVIGGHEAASRQLLVVLAGRVVASTHDDAVELVRTRQSSGRKASGMKRVL